MQTIAIVNEKGGTGKTTTAVNLAAALGELKRKVLLVDLDGQAASSRWLGVEEDTSFADALWHGEPPRPVENVAPGVSLLPGSGKLDSVAHDLRPTQGGQLRKLLSQVSGFDYAVIDCPPSLGNRLIGNALLAAAQAIVPVETSILALDGLRILLTTLQDVRDGFGHDIALAGVVACRYDARTKLSRLVLAELKRALPGKVFKTVIRENVRMRECPGSGQSILSYAPDCHAAEDYRALAQEVLALSAGGSAGKGKAPARESAETAHEAMANMRKQVEVMLRKLGPIAEEEEAAARAAGRDSPPAGEMPAEPTAGKPAPTFVQPDEEAPVDEPEESIVNIPADGPATDKEAATVAENDQVWDLGSAESEPSTAGKPPGEDEQSWDVGSPGKEAPVKAGAARKSSAPGTDAASDKPTKKESRAARPKRGKDESWEVGPAGEEAAAAAAEDKPSRKAKAGKTEPPAAAEPSEKQPAAGKKKKDYPALRGLVREMSGQTKSDARDDRQRRKPAKKGGKTSGWWRVFRRKAATK